MVKMIFSEDLDIIRYPMNKQNHNIKKDLCIIPPNKVIRQVIYTSLLRPCTFTPDVP